MMLTEQLVWCLSGRAKGAPIREDFEIKQYYILIAHN